MITGVNSFKIGNVALTTEPNALKTGVVASIAFCIKLKDAFTATFKLSIFCAMSFPVTATDRSLKESIIFAIPLAAAFFKLVIDVSIPKLFSLASLAIIPVPVPTLINSSLN